MKGKGGLLGIGWLKSRAGVNEEPLEDVPVVPYVRAWPAIPDVLARLAIAAKRLGRLPGLDPTPGPVYQHLVTALDQMVRLGVLTDNQASEVKRVGLLGIGWLKSCAGGLTRRTGGARSRENRGDWTPISGRAHSPLAGARAGAAPPPCLFENPHERRARATSCGRITAFL